MTAWGISELKLMRKENEDKGSDDFSLDQKLAYETYAGNWMRDFSQVFVPKLVIDIVGIFPSNISVKRAIKGGNFFGDPVGSDGAEAILTGFLKSVAILELGEDIGKRLITSGNLGAYRADEHMDNPAGYTLNGDFLVKVNKQITKNNQTAVKEVFVPAGQVDRPKQLESVGAKGFSDRLQAEESFLYELNRNGLALHIHNTTELVKENFIQAIKADDDSKRRILFGRGLHAIEDFFAHSNYIEVLLNIVLQRPDDFGIPKDSKLRSPPDVENPLIGSNNQVIDTLFEIPIQSPSGVPKGSSDEVLKTASLRRQAITTGTFGLTDTIVSITHVVLGIFDSYIRSIDRSIDELIDLAKNGQDPSIENLKKKKESKRRAEALDALFEGFDAAQVTFPIIGIEVKKLRDIVNVDKSPIPIPDALKDASIPVSLPDEVQVSLKEALKILEKFLKVSKIIFQFRNTLLTLMGFKRFLPDAVVEILKFLLDKISEEITKVINRIKLEVKIQIIRFILFITSTDAEKAKEIKREKLEEFAKVPGKFISHLILSIKLLEPSTSLQTRIKKDLKDKVTNEKIVPKQHNPVTLLPPSHSEICKDHPPSLHDGSIFFALHEELAIEAVRHLTIIMHELWQNKGTKVTTGPIPLPMNPLGDLEKDAQKMADASKENLGAGQISPSSESVAKKRGVTPIFRQLDSTVPATVKKLLNAVDLYVSHPQDAPWWRILVKKHLSNKSNQDKISEEINIRNQTRRKRA